MSTTYVMHNPFTDKSYEYTTRDEKEEKLYKALDMVLEDKVRERLVATETMDVPRINEHINPDYSEYKKRFRY